MTLNDRMDLATALQANGRYPAAEAEYRDVIQLQEKVIGPEHAHTLNTRNNLAELLDDEGKYAEAEAECRHIIGLEEKVVGPEHRLTLNSRGNLAVAVIGQGRIEEAQSSDRGGHEVDGRETWPGLSRHREFHDKICDRPGASRQDAGSHRHCRASRGARSHDLGFEPSGHTEICQAFGDSEKPEVTTNLHADVSTAYE